MRRVAMLCYFFPPIGGGGTPRSVEFVKHLPRFGYRPTVVTVQPVEGTFEREFQSDGEALEELSDSSFDLLRVPNPEARGLRDRLEKWSVFPYAWALAYPWFRERAVSWAKRAAQELVRKGRQSKFDVIYASAGPTCSLEAAAWAAKKLKTPWVADLRDLWTRDTLARYPSRLHYWWESRLEKSLLQTADAIIANTPLAGQRLREWLADPAASRVAVIPNGFDLEQFGQVDTRRPGGASESFTIVHAGTLYRAEIRRSRWGHYLPAALDHEARSPLPVAKALVALRKMHPRLASQIVIRLLGYVPESSRRAIHEMGLSDQIVCEGVVPRAEAVTAVRRADALLVVQVAWEDPDRPMPYVPGKVYEYLATGSPILAPVGPGDLRDLLSEAPQAYVCDYRDPEATAHQIQRLVRDRRQGNVQRCDAEWLSQFDRRHLTRRLAEVFDSIR